MGSFIEVNDTLQITREQGFPAELDYQRHREQPFHADLFKGRVFSFSNKPAIRIYHIPPVRCFFVENIDGKWLYWGHVHVLEVHHDYLNKTTSGTFRIEHIFTPEEMLVAHAILDQRPEKDYFAS